MQQQYDDADGGDNGDNGFGIDPDLAYDDRAPGAGDGAHDEDDPHRADGEHREDRQHQQSRQHHEHAGLAGTDPGAAVPTATAAAGQAGDPLDTMPLDLTFELGRLSLSLGELRTLGAGAVLLLDGGSPAAVAIVAAGKTMGRGEIVDVAGQLGVRLTQWGTPC